MNSLRALVLNSSYEPLQFTGAKRALVLVLLGKADAIENDGFFARTVTKSFRLPTVIKLNRYIRRPYRLGVNFSKKKRDQAGWRHVSILRLPWQGAYRGSCYPEIFWGKVRVGERCCGVPKM